MHPALWISKTGLDAQQTAISVISNNLANVNTTGFKQNRPVFEDLMYRSVQQPGSATSDSTQAPSGFTVGTGVRTVATQRQFTTGSITQTENALDVAIVGRGFFQVTLPDGSTAYQRAGNFQVDANGQMVTNSGYQLQPPITVPQGSRSLNIGNDGTVTVIAPGATAATTLGTIQLTDFINPAGLEAQGQNLYRETEASGAPVVANPGVNGVGTLQQGALESSNVNVVEELVNMIQTQRAYEMNSKAIETVDRMLQYINQQL